MTQTEDAVLVRARTLFNDARVAKGGKDLVQARVNAREAIELLRSEGEGEDGEAPLGLISDLGTFVDELGDLRAAERARQRVLEVSERALPDEHPDLQKARGDLAITIFKLGDPLHSRRTR